MKIGTYRNSFHKTNCTVLPLMIACTPHCSPKLNSTGLNLKRIVAGRIQKGYWNYLYNWDEELGRLTYSHQTWPTALLTWRDGFCMEHICTVGFMWTPSHCEQTYTMKTLPAGGKKAGSLELDELILGHHWWHWQTYLIPLLCQVDSWMLGYRQRMGFGCLQMGFVLSSPGWRNVPSGGRGGVCSHQHWYIITI